MAARLSNGTALLSFPMFFGFLLLEGFHIVKFNDGMQGIKIALAVFLLMLAPFGATLGVQLLPRMACISWVGGIIYSAVAFGAVTLIAVIFQGMALLDGVRPEVAYTSMFSASFFAGGICLIYLGVVTWIFAFQPHYPYTRVAGPMVSAILLNTYLFPAIVICMMGMEPFLSLPAGFASIINKVPSEVSKVKDPLIVLLVITILEAIVLMGIANLREHLNDQGEIRPGVWIIGTILIVSPFVLYSLSRHGGASLVGTLLLTLPVLWHLRYPPWWKTRDQAEREEFRAFNERFRRAEPRAEEPPPESPRPAIVYQSREEDEEDFFEVLRKRPFVLGLFSILLSLIALVMAHGRNAIQKPSPAYFVGVVILAILIATLIRFILG